MLKPIRIVVVDDSAFFRKALTAEIARYPGFDVVGTAADGRSAIEQVRKLKPDVVTLDVEMPIMGGLDALRIIATESDAAVIMVSAQTASGAKVTLDALELGAIDFIPKTRGAALIHEKLVAAAHARRTVAAGRRERPGVSQGRQQPTLAAGRKFRLIVVGSSTGGPQALTTLCSALPATLSVPIVVAQHMPPHFTEALAKRLDTRTPLRVVHASDGDRLLPNTVYVAPGGSTMRVKPGELSVSFEESGNLYKPSVDALTASAIAVYGGHVLGVLLTGMGADGAKEMHNLHKLGGHTVAQDQATCVVYGMPKALVDCGGASEVLPIEDIAPRLSAMCGAKPG